MPSTVIVRFFTYKSAEINNISFSEFCLSHPPSKVILSNEDSFTREFFKGWKFVITNFKGVEVIPNTNSFKYLKYSQVDLCTEKIRDSPTKGWTDQFGNLGSPAPQVIDFSKLPLWTEKSDFPIFCSKPVVIERCAEFISVQFLQTLVTVLAELEVRGINPIGYLTSLISNQTSGFISWYPLMQENPLGEVPKYEGILDSPALAKLTDLSLLERTSAVVTKESNGMAEIQAKLASLEPFSSPRGNK